MTKRIIGMMITALIAGLLLAGAYLLLYPHARVLTLVPGRSSSSLIHSLNDARHRAADESRADAVPRDDRQTNFSPRTFAGADA